MRDLLGVGLPKERGGLTNQDYRRFLVHEQDTVDQSGNGFGVTSDLLPVSLVVEFPVLADENLGHDIANGVNDDDVHLGVEKRDNLLLDFTARLGLNENQLIVVHAQAGSEILVVGSLDVNVHTDQSLLLPNPDGL